MSPPLFMQVVNRSSANFWLDAVPPPSAFLLLAVRRLGDVAHQLLAAVGLGHVVDAHHDGVRLRALDLLARERVGHHRHVGGDAAFHRAFGARRRVRVPARAPEARSAATTGFKLISPKKESARFPGRCAACSYCALPVPLVRAAGRRVARRARCAGRLRPVPRCVPVLPRAAGAAACPPGCARRAAAAPRRTCGTHPIRRARSCRRRSCRWRRNRRCRRLAPLELVPARAAVAGRRGLGLARRAGWSCRPWARARAARPGGRPASPELCARMRLSPAADTCAAKGRANAPATATTSNFLKFIQSPG